MTEGEPNPENFVAPLKDIIRRAGRRLDEKVPDGRAQQHFYWTGQDESVFYHFYRLGAEPQGCLSKSDVVLVGDLTKGFFALGIRVNLDGHFKINNAPRQPEVVTKHTVWKSISADLPGLLKMDNDLKWGHPIDPGVFRVTAAAYEAEATSTTTRQPQQTL